MKKTLLLLAVIISFDSLGQINSAYLNKEQKQNIWNLYKEAGVKAIFETRIKGGEVSGYTIEILDTLGRTTASFSFNSKKELTGNIVYLFDDLNQLIRTEKFSGDEVFIINDYFYNVEGEQIESVQLNKEGTINSKTVYFYTPDGLKDYAEIFGPDGKMTFKQAIQHTNELPTSISLTHTKGFVMSSDDIEYNGKSLPKTKNSTITMSGKKSRYEYKYDESNLLIKVLEYSDGSLESTQESKNLKEGFEEQLSELGFDFSNAAHSSKIQGRETYYLKNLASFPNGEEALAKYLKENTNYPRKARKTGIHGIVIVFFAIESDGSIVDIEVRRGLHPILDKEAISIVKNMPNWNPAEQSNGEFYKSTASVAIQF